MSLYSLCTWEIPDTLHTLTFDWPSSGTIGFRSPFHPTPKRRQYQLELRHPSSTNLQLTRKPCPSRTCSEGLLLIETLRESTAFLSFRFPPHQDAVGLHHPVTLLPDQHPLRSVSVAAINCRAIPVVRIIVVGCCRNSHGAILLALASPQFERASQAPLRSDRTSSTSTI